MDRYYTKHNDRALAEELESWVNTPYSHYTGVKQGGVDCIHLVVRVLQNTSADQGRKLIVPWYAKDWHLHKGEEMLVKEIEKQIFVQRIAYLDNATLIEIEPIANGDIVLFKFGRVSSHCGIYYNGLVYQTLSGSGVKKVPYASSDFKKRVTVVYKVYKRID